MLYDWINGNKPACEDLFVNINGCVFIGHNFRMRH